MSEKIQTQSNNWEKVQDALKKGTVHLEPSIDEDVPTNEKWDYSVVLKTGHTWGASLKKDGEKLIFLNIKNEEIHQANIVAWQKHQQIDVIFPENQNPFSTGGEGFW
jgi:hypothetical protein